MDAERAREAMVRQQLMDRGITDARVLDAFRAIPRPLFVPEALRERAYEDHPLPVGCEQTISQPLIIALMLQTLHLQGHERVLEIGTGTGYEAALLSRLALEVYSMERWPDLAAAAASHLASLGIANVDITVGDGTLGWPEHAPYDGIVVAAGAPRVPEPLADQLTDGGRLVIPLGKRKTQSLYVMRRQGASLTGQPLGECMFVPLVGAHGWPEE